MAAAVILSVAPARAATLIHDYEFNGNLNDSLGGPALVPNGGTINAATYDFAAGQGLSLSNWVTGSATSGNWTIDLSFLFQDISGYRKIVDFKNRTADNGLYNLNGNLVYYNFANGTGFPIVANTTVRVDLTRDGTTGMVIGYVNGAQQFSFTDSSSDATFSAANNIINFLEDDTTTGGEESAGRVSQIRIYDGALTAAEVAALGPPKPAPEPSSLTLLALGLVVGGGLLARRRR